MLKAVKTKTIKLPSTRVSPRAKNLGMRMKKYKC